MDRPSREACEECEFRYAVDVEVSDTGHGLVQDIVQFFVIYVAVSPFYAVLRRSMTRHIVRSFEQ